MTETLGNTVNMLQDRYPGWVFIGGSNSAGGYCIAGISPDRQLCEHNVGFEWSPVIRRCGDTMDELELEFAFNIGNREYDGVILVPIQDMVGDIDWNPFVQEVEPLEGFNMKPVETREH